MDAYCERVGPGLLAEPLNAVSNASFLLAALAAWVLAARWHPFGGSPSADCDRSLRRYREHPVAHVPHDVDASSR